MPLNLTDFLNTSAYPYQAELSLSGGNKLAVTYRAEDADRCRAAILAATGEGFAALGFDPSIALKAFVGQAPKGDALTAFTAALEALDTAGEDRFAALLETALGESVADVLGSLEAILPDGKREAFDAEISAETCAALPADVKRAIVRLAASACVPAKELGFLGK